MNYEKFTIKTQEALQEASSIAIKNDNSEISTEHVLLALLEQQEGLVTPIVERIGIPSLDLQKKVKDIILSNPKVSGTNQVYFSSEMQKILAKAEKEMVSLHNCIFLRWSKLVVPVLFWGEIKNNIFLSFQKQ